MERMAPLFAAPVIPSPGTVSSHMITSLVEFEKMIWAVCCLCNLVRELQLFYKIHSQKAVWGFGKLNGCADHFCKCPEHLVMVPAVVAAGQGFGAAAEEMLKGPSPSSLLTEFHHLGDPYLFYACFEMAPFDNHSSTLPQNETSTTCLQSSQSVKTEYHGFLLFIYSVVLVSGISGVGLMAQILWSSVKSLTTIAVLNLIFAHFIFLLTVPFRMYYYATHCWSLSFGWCKIVSSMIHIHMYMSFIFYVIILVTRLLTFYHKTKQTEFQWKLHALVISIMVWLLVIIVVPCVVYFLYGVQDKETQSNNNSSCTNKTGAATNNSTGNCFHFGKFMCLWNNKMFNYATSVMIIIVAMVLTALQARVLVVVRRKYGRGWASQQVFWASLKSLCFALIMTVCFVPYHIFRLYYLQNIDLEAINEVFLSITTFTCLDMLTFMGRGSCYMCCKGQSV
ncbi:probable G-protein coupled receptor 141 [Lampris incognitus]|uniref:probable G-protein coupled receptor 141 n=1 Tax=Lampris incognitus TaxID=2546036 RepID=UPI0024B5929C|nr:probable G-protein coupled receptor 141 [Lampris incognitus]